MKKRSEAMLSPLPDPNRDGGETKKEADTKAPAKNQPIVVEYLAATPAAPHKSA